MEAKPKRMRITRGLKIRYSIYALLILGIIMVLPSWVNRQLYPAPVFDVPEEPPEPYVENVILTMADGIRLQAWHQRARGDDQVPVVIFFHGNGENLGTLWYTRLFDDFAKLGCHFIALDYPGYGRSEGRPSEVGLLAAADLAIDWARQRYPQKPMILVGWSLGAAVAAQAAKKHQEHLSGLILLSAWSTLADVAEVHFPKFLVRLLVKETYDSVAAAKAIQLPSLVIHGKIDAIIPAGQGAAVAEALPGAQWLYLPNRGHNDIMTDQKLWDEMGRFIAEINQSAIEPSGPDGSP